MVSILFIAFFVLIVIGVPIAISLGVASLTAIHFASHMPFLILPQKIFKRGKQLSIHGHSPVPAGGKHHGRSKNFR